MDKKLNDNVLENVTGGVINMTNPVAGKSREEMEKVAATLGEGQDMGSWKTMSGERFLEWWRESNKEKRG